MGMYDVYQSSDVFESFRKGKGLILNPATLAFTIADNPHPADDKGYSKAKYSNYELAEIQINGWQGSDKTRPFMYELKNLMDGNYRHHVRPIIQNNMSYHTDYKGWIVDWDTMAEKLQRLGEKMLAQDVSPMLKPVEKTTQKKKNQYGYGNKTLYATGELFKALRVEVNYI